MKIAKVKVGDLVKFTVGAASVVSGDKIIPRLTSAIEVINEDK